MPPDKSAARVPSISQQQQQQQQRGSQRQEQQVTALPHERDTESSAKDELDETRDDNRQQQQQQQQQQRQQLAVATINNRTSGRRGSTVSDNTAKIDIPPEVGPPSKASELAPAATQTAGKKRRSSRLFFNPSDAFCHWWSGVVSLAFLYNFWALSYRFAFKEIDSSTVTVWFIFDYTADFIYLNDILINFRTGHLEEGVLQRDPNVICGHYFESILFYLDASCLLPFDILYLSFGYWSILRCNRLVKIYKFWSFVDRTERHTNYPNVFRTFTLVHYILVIFHWNACLFYMISKHKIIDIESLYKINNNQCNDISCQYLHAFYWSTLALTLIGDLPRPRARGEFIYVIVELFFGLFLFTSVLGHVANIVTNVSAARKEFQAKLDAVKTFMRTRRVSDELQNKVIRWFDYLWISQKSSDEEKSVACLPDRLKAEIAIHVNLDTLKRVDIFQNTEAGFLCELVLRLKAVLFSPGDYVCRKNEVGHEMYIVSRGILEVVTNEGQTVVATFRAGSYFGEIAVLNVGSAGNKRTASVRSVGYSDLFCLSKQDLWDVLKDYPNAEARIRAVAEERLSMLTGAGFDKKTSDTNNSNGNGSGNNRNNQASSHAQHQSQQRAAPNSGPKRPATSGASNGKRQYVPPASASCPAPFKHTSNCTSADCQVGAARQRHRNCAGESGQSGDGQPAAHRRRVGSSSSTCHCFRPLVQADRYPLECMHHQCHFCSHGAAGGHPQPRWPARNGPPNPPRGSLKHRRQQAARCNHCDAKPDCDHEREQQYLLSPLQMNLRHDLASRAHLSPLDCGRHLHAPGAYSSSTNDFRHGAGAWLSPYNRPDVATFGSGSQRMPVRDSKSFDTARQRAHELECHKCLAPEEQQAAAHRHSPVSLSALAPDRRRSGAAPGPGQVGQPLDGASTGNSAYLNAGAGGSSFRAATHRSSPSTRARHREQLTSTAATLIAAGSVSQRLDEQARDCTPVQNDRSLNRRSSSLVQVVDQSLLDRAGHGHGQCRHTAVDPLTAVTSYDLSHVNAAETSLEVCGSAVELPGDASLAQQPETAPVDLISGATGSPLSSSSEATLGPSTNQHRAKRARNNRVASYRKEQQDQGLLEQDDWASSDTNSLGSFAQVGQLGDNNATPLQLSDTDQEPAQRSQLATTSRQARSISSLDFEPIEPRRPSGHDEDDAEFRIDIGDK